ncbi:hypothetical protein A9168_14975 [Macellibacteroides sp. HH-ZS]|nr:hypothetical protein A9168_14975 [Macellibacteroides sp. HH-ZS]
MITPTYKIPIKDLSRQLVWEHAVDSLTINRELSRILNKEYIERLWEYVFDDILIKNGIASEYDRSYLRDWLSYSDIIYQSKRPNDLKIALFCGPEPENDVNHLLALGVRIENIYAFEYDKRIFDEAIKSLKGTFPTLKIYNGKIENFILSNPIKFDIIYLDFTSSILTEFQTVSTIIDHNCLSELGILAINTCYPDKSDNNIKFLTDFFHFQSCFEYCVFNGGNNEGRFIESSNAYAYDHNKTHKLITEHFEEAYSAFQTSYLANYTNHIKPYLTVLNNSILRKRLFDMDDNKIAQIKHAFKTNLVVYAEPDLYSLYHFFNTLIDKKWQPFIEKNRAGKFSRKDVATLMYAFLDSKYESYEDVLSKSLKTALPKINANIPDHNGGIFCDVPMIHLWLEIAINQLGYPYHINMRNHKRYAYTSKTRKMCLDIFSFDQCRALYDWLPMIEYYGDDLSILERQMISRICVDAIGKHTIHFLERQFYGAAIVGINEFPWSANHCIPERQIL